MGTGEYEVVDGYNIGILVFLLSCTEHSGGEKDMGSVYWEQQPCQGC
jgi:hypothetical protein